MSLILYDVVYFHSKLESMTYIRFFLRVLLLILHLQKNDFFNKKLITYKSNRNVSLRKSGKGIVR